MARQINAMRAAMGKADIGSGPERDAIEAILAGIDFKGWTVLAGDVAPIVDEIVRDGAYAALTQVHIDATADKAVANVVNDYALAYAESRSANMVGMRRDELGRLVPNPNAHWQITEGTREHLRADVRAAIEQGLSNDALSAKIAESYGFSKARATVIARTETIRASNEGALAGYKASGVVDGKEWLTAEDDKVTPECAENGAAGVLPLDGAFPSGDQCPPTHPNCRCTISPVVVFESERPAGQPLPAVVAVAAAPVVVPVAPRVTPPVEWVGKVSDTFRAAMEGALAAIPDAVMRKLAASTNTKFVFGERVTQIMPSLKGVHPRGWPSGSTWDSADGFQSQGTIATAETYQPIGQKGFVTATRAAGVMAHETGHAFDRALSWASRSPDFIKAYNVDAKPLRAAIKAGESGAQRFSYYLQRGEAGPSEAFAEIFAQAIVGGSGSHQRDILQFFPTVAAIMRRFVDELEASA